MIGLAYLPARVNQTFLPVKALNAVVLSTPS